ncbi:hypothetical protein C5O00_12860 [Pukyongia salina]|uniref:Uncharacterized protein n=1 Tax=Pukyongia salina TaxID=2094025 RepID=A0A2S0HZF3_9FLAO|nr:hypothetical protein [Pukyongia salina]AVI51996.1 hypothetical protein C5O00_12860 [Pukyongia salina]
MRKHYLIALLTVSTIATAQIGIGTDRPLADLHIAGGALVQGGFTTQNLNTVSSTEEDFKLVTRVTNSTPVGKITILDTDVLNVAPVNTVNYHFTNVNLDNLDDVNLQYDVDKYVVGVANFRHVGDAIQKVPGGDNFSIGHFVVRTFKSGGTWHLQIKNEELDLLATNSLEYYIQLIVYDKKYFRDLPVITTNLGGSNTGTASSIPVFE